MRLVIISPPEEAPDESRLVCRMLEDSSIIFHLRKPGRTAGQLADYLYRIPADYHSRIMVHDHHLLLDPFSLRGVHFTERARLRDPDFPKVLKQKLPEYRFSTAFHRFPDIPEPDGTWDYLTLSPIFDSISKPNYPAAFDHGRLRDFLSRTGHRVIALGGITVEKVFVAARLGFTGVAVLGAVWKAPSPVAAVRALSAVCLDIGKIGDQ